MGCLLDSAYTASNSSLRNSCRNSISTSAPCWPAWGGGLARGAQVIDRVGRELAADERFREEMVEPPRSGRIEAWGDQGVTITVTARTRPAARWDGAGG